MEQTNETKVIKKRHRKLTPQQIEYNEKLKNRNSYNGNVPYRKRTMKIIDKIAQGESYRNMITFIMKAHKVNAIVAEETLNKVYDELKQSETVVKRTKDIAIERLEYILKQSLIDGDLKTSIAATKELNQLQGNYPAKQLTVDESQTKGVFRAIFNTTDDDLTKINKGE